MKGPTQVVKGSGAVHSFTIARTIIDRHEIHIRLLTLF
jgi:hypothetical protein